MTDTDAVLALDGLGAAGDRPPEIAVPMAAHLIGVANDDRFV